MRVDNKKGEFFMSSNFGSMPTRTLILSLIIVVVSACSNVTIRSQGGEKDHSEPSYMDSKAFYLGGLVGEHRVDVNEVCEGAQVSQMQTVATVSDYFFGMVTLFIYSPRTVKVWCDE
jgi:Bor protein